ncbi:MAG: hypothetical protein KDB05_04890 [Planctomycetales bacterium]|nr:hypothetical protein [Planctomycetales bacterium]
MRSRHRRLRYELLETRDLLTAVHIASDHIRHTNNHVKVPVNIDDATGVRAAEIRIEYDTTQLDVRPSDITAGSAWGGKALVMSNVDEAAGTIVAFVFATKNIESGSGGLIDVSFTIRKDAQEAQTVVDLAEVRLNEGQVPLTAVPVAGFDTTDGVITIRRSVVRPFERTLGNRIELVCVAEVSQHVGPMPAPLSPHVTPLLPKLSTSNEKPTWQRHKHSFVGPIADHLFATTDRWLYWR